MTQVRNVDVRKVSHPTQHKIGDFGDVFPANLLARTEETKLNTTKANIHPKHKNTTQNKHTKKTNARFRCVV